MGKIELVADHMYDLMRGLNIMEIQEALDLLSTRVRNEYNEHVKEFSN